MKYLMVLSLLLLLPLVLIWWWAGRALPPASVINLDLEKEKRDDLNGSGINTWEECSTEDPHPFLEASLPHGAKKGRTVIIASDFVYTNGPPQLNTVSVRADILKFTVIIFLLLLWFHPDADNFAWLERWIIASPAISCAFAVIALVISLLLGVIRQTCNALLSQAGAIPCLDKSGRPTFAYAGDVPHDKWQHSPWVRVISWVVVALTSVFSALVAAILQEVWFMADMFQQTFFAVIVVRWCISAIPRLLVMFNRDGE